MFKLLEKTKYNLFKSMAVLYSDSLMIKERFAAVPIFLKMALMEALKKYSIRDFEMKITKTY